MRRVFEERPSAADPVTAVRPPADHDPDALRRALAPYGTQQQGPTEHQEPRGGRHARPADRRAAATAGVAVVVLCGAAAAVLSLGGDPAPPASTTAPPALEASTPTVSGRLLPGGTVTGSVLVSHRGTEPVQVEDVVLARPATDACTTTGVSLAPTLPPTPESPLEVPAGGTATVEWTAYMDGESEQACQGAVLTSEVLLDGEPVGTVTLTAGSLEQPPAPTGGLTTSTRAAVHWSPSTVADPGWVVERAAAGTGDWRPACGSSPARPVRALSCTDTGLTGSTAYVYRVTLRTGHWHVTSPPSEPVTTQARPSA